MLLVLIRIGRKPALTISCFFLACFMTGSAFAPDYATFAAFRFFCGLCSEAIFAIAFVWGILLFIIIIFLYFFFF